MKTNIVIIAAISRNGCIGENGHLPWYIPEELAQFKNDTLGGILICGKTTANSLRKGITSMADREIYEVARDGNRIINGIQHAINSEKNAYIVGGTGVFAEGMEYAESMLITIIDSDFYGDRYFPYINQNVWKKTFKKDIHAYGWKLQQFEFKK